MPSQGRSWYQSLVMCGYILEDAMANSHVGEVGEQVRGRDLASDQGAREEG